MLTPRTESERGRIPGAAQAATSHAAGSPDRSAKTASNAGTRSMSLENRMATSMPFSSTGRLGHSGG